MARDITVTVSGNLPLDALRAITEEVNTTEARFEKQGAFNANTNPNGVADVTTKERILTGATPHAIYVFTLTRVLATGKYTFAYTATYPNISAKKEAEAAAAA